MANHNVDMVPTIAVGRGYTGLGMLRSLAGTGIPTYGACPSDDVAARSRWFRPTPGPVHWDGSPGADAMRFLQDMPLATAVLIPGADDAALWLSDIPNSPLSDRFKVSSSSRETLEILQDKSRFGQFLAQIDIPHPRTFTISSFDDIAAIPFAELDRVFIKPADSQLFSRVTGEKGVWAEDRSKFMEVWHKLDERGFKLIAQEYVPGSAADHYFIDGFRDRNGGFPGLFARRRERFFPPDFGNTTSARSIPLSDVEGALKDLTRLLEKLNYRGIFSAEFKRDARNGEFRLLEINTRAWWYVEFAMRCGVNVCKMAYEDALELPVTPASRDYLVGASCVNLVSDIRSVLAQDPATRGPLMRTLGQWARSYYHVFRMDDPGPGLLASWRLLRRMLA
jgi:predicted ATP-grasp superfamily ATP-dependent carboligase